MKSFIGEGTGVEPEDNRQLPSRPWAPGSGQACRKKHSRISLIPGWRRKFARCYTKRIELVCTKESRPVPPHLQTPDLPTWHSPVHPKQRLLSQRQPLRGTRTPGVRARPKGQRLLLLSLCLGTVGWPGDVPPPLLLGFIRSCG